MHTPVSPRRRRTRTSPVPRAGFTLVEVMIALGLLGFGILGVTAGQLTAMRMTTVSRAEMQAMYLAEQQMETFQSMSAGDVAALVSAGGYPYDPANPIDADPNDADPTLYTRSWNIQPDVPETGVISLAVSVSWTDAQGNTRTVTLDGLKADL